MRSTINRKKVVKPQIKAGDLVENINDNNFVILVDEVLGRYFSGTVVSQGSDIYREGSFSKDWLIDKFTPFTGTSVILSND